VPALDLMKSRILGRDHRGSERSRTGSQSSVRLHGVVLERTFGVLNWTPSVPTILTCSVRPRSRRCRGYTQRRIRTHVLELKADVIEAGYVVGEASEKAIPIRLLPKDERGADGLDRDVVDAKAGRLLSDRSMRHL